MTLEQLKMLKQVYQSGSLKKASAAMFKTQPAISQGIKQLESDLGVSIFNRDGYRLVLTAEGEQIYQHALRVLNESSQIEQLAKHFSHGNEPIIRLAFEASFDLNIFLPLLDKIQNEFPKTQIVLKQEYLSGPMESLINLKVDLIISPNIEILSATEDIDSLLIHESFMTVVAAPRLLMRHPNLNQIQELQNEYQIIVQDTGTATKDLELGVQKGQRKWYVNDFNTKKTLILSGMGWGSLPHFLIESELNEQSLLPIKINYEERNNTIKYYAMKMKNTILGPVAEKLWKDLKQLAL